MSDEEVEKKAEQEKYYASDIIPQPSSIYTHPTVYGITHL